MHQITRRSLIDKAFPSIEGMKAECGGMRRVASHSQHLAVPGVKNGGPLN